MATPYEKLVRDKIPEILDEKGIPYEARVASDEEYKDELYKKLEEEVREFLESKAVDELADVMEVIRALRKLPEYEDAKEIQRIKRDERGAFDDRIIVKGEK